MPVLDMTGLNTQTAPMDAIAEVLSDYHGGFTNAIEMEVLMNGYDSWLTHNPADDGREMDVELYYECQNEWAVVANDIRGDWEQCDFADYIELPDTWVSFSGVASGELTCPKCGVIESFEFEVPRPEDDREWDD